MIARKSVIFTFICTFLSSSLYAGQIIFSEEFDDIASFWQIQNCGSGKGNVVAASGEKAFSGKNNKALKIVLNEKAFVPKSCKRAEISEQRRDWFDYRQIRWNAFAVYIAEDYPDQGGLIVMQTHGRPDDRCSNEPWRQPPYAIGTKEGKWVAIGRWDDKTCSPSAHIPNQYSWFTDTPIQRGTWTIWVIQMCLDWKKGGTGFMKTWQRTASEKEYRLIGNYKGPNCYNDQVNINQKMGIYHGSNTSNMCSGCSYRIYYDSYYVGKEFSSLEDFLGALPREFNAGPGNTEIGSFTPPRTPANRATPRKRYSIDGRLTIGRAAGGLAGISVSRTHFLLPPQLP